MKNCRPLMIEFMGSPEAGKTTAIDSIVKSLNDLGIITSKIRESAESVPSYYPKGSLSAHFWMRLNTAKSISEQYHKNSDDVIIIDRGIYDTMFWNEILKNKGELNKSECYVADSFFEMLHLKPDFTICLFVCFTRRKCFQKRWRRTDCDKGIYLGFQYQIALFHNNAQKSRHRSF